MNFRKSIQSPATLLGFIGLAIMIGSVALHAQTKQILQWKADLEYLKSASNEELINQRVAVEQIRTGIEFWIKMHPGSKIELKEAPAKPWGVEEIRSQVASLSEAIETILAEESGRPFELGVTTISVTAESSPLSPITDSIGRNQIVDRDALNVAAALDYLPGLAIDHATAGRNEASIRLRGFSSKGQVPFYVDGIPVSMPYDGTVDFNRFLSSDIAEIQVAKGFSSPLLGPNGMGGSINLVTRQPKKKLQADLLLGTGSGDMLLASANVGTRWNKFYVQGSMDWNQIDYIPLSGDFPLVPDRAPIPASPGVSAKPGVPGQMNYERVQSDTSDARYSGRFGFTPRGEDQYVFSFVNQKGEKGVPVYIGPNLEWQPNNFTFRRWPYWNKTGYYFISNTGLSEANSLKLRVYYDQFKNEMDFYDLDTGQGSWTTMSGTNANLSKYNDHSAGASAEFVSRYVPKNTMSASFVFRDDNHKDYTVYPGRSPNPFVTPTILIRAQTFSMGYQDIVPLTSRLRLTFGFSADYLKGMQVQRLNQNLDTVIPVTCAENPSNDSFKGCLPRGWTYNPQASLAYTVSSRDNIYLTFADRSRFPLLKEIYSYSLRKGLPNPDLSAERNTGLNVGYSHAFGVNTVAQLEYFYNRLRDAIESAYIYDPGSILCPGNTTGATAQHCSQNVNLGKEIHQGFEFSLRSTPLSRLTLDVNYSYLNRTIAFDFSGRPDIDAGLTSMIILPTYPKNKALLNAVVRLPHNILAIGGFRYEGGIYLQDTSWSRNDPRLAAYSSSYGVVDLGTVVPITAGFSAQLGMKNLLDRNYYYTAGYPEAGRNWYLNMRYKF